MISLFFRLSVILYLLILLFLLYLISNRELYSSDTVPPIHYSLKLSNATDKATILNHFTSYPLIGHKRISFNLWSAHLHKTP